MSIITQIEELCEKKYEQIHKLQAKISQLEVENKVMEYRRLNLERDIHREDIRALKRTVKAIEEESGNEHSNQM